MERLRVLVANPSPLLRAIEARACSADGIDVVGQASSCDGLLEQARRTQAHVVLSTTGYDDGPLSQVLRNLLASRARVLVVDDEPKPALLNALLFAGISGYLHIGDIGPTELVAGVRAVAAGDAALHPAAAALVLEQWRAMRQHAPVGDNSPRTELTVRELEVLTAMADGLATKAIALHLKVATKTVENHKARVFAKLGARNHAHAVSIAVTQGLLPPSYQPVDESRP
jgi:DNA-binding NarL/FixJ family response regulator